MKFRLRTLLFGLVPFVAVVCYVGTYLYRERYVDLWSGIGGYPGGQPVADAMVKELVKSGWKIIAADADVDEEPNLYRLLEHTSGKSRFTIALWISRSRVYGRIRTTGRRIDDPWSADRDYQFMLKALMYQNSKSIVNNLQQGY